MCLRSEWTSIWVWHEIDLAIVCHPFSQMADNVRLVPVEVLLQGTNVFAQLSGQMPRVEVVKFGDLLPLALLPPIFLYVGTC